MSESAPLSVGDWLREATARLAAAGIEEARLDAELLLAHSLGFTRAALLAHPERPLSRAEAEILSALLKRRAMREPLPYLTGWREFFGLGFSVDPNVLIPRPETELLVERALAWAAGRGLPSALTLADVGTGCGCIAVALAVHLPQAMIYASDLSADALAVARRNAARHGVASRVRFCQGDLLAALPEPVQMIVANLPYISQQEWPNLPPEVRWEPRWALDGGPDGLDLVRRLLVQAPHYLASNGALLLEIGARQGEAAIRLARAAFPRAEVSLLHDGAGCARVIQVCL
jgi:release factor glutamine methyltransferase